MGSTHNRLRSVPQAPAAIFNGMHSTAIRVWHWLSVLVISGSIITVILASTVFRTRNTISLVQAELTGKGITASPDQARAVAHAFNDILWDLHKYVGFALCALVLFRIAIEATAPSDKKMTVQLKRALGFKPVEELARLEQQHYVQVKFIYLVFYVALILMALTGLGLAFEDVPLFHAYHRSIKQIHAFLQWVIYGFIVLHITGVILADLGKYKGLVSGMIHGRRLKD